MVTLAGVDLYNPDSFVDGVPHDLFRRLRKEAPVHWHEEPEGRGFWVLSTYQDVIAASQDWETFSSAHGGVNIADAQGGAELMMVNLDAPRHTKLRGLVSQGFTPKLTRRMESHVREIATSIIDNVAQKGECDFVTEIAAELPLQVIAELIGIPKEDRHQIFEWSNQMIAVGDPEYADSLDVATKAATAMFEYANALTAERRVNPKEDLVTVLIGADVDGEKLDDMEFNFFFLLLAVAGNETTRNLISGGMTALFEYPDQRARLMEDRSLLPSAVEEMLRWVTPVMYFRRTATHDTQIRDQKIAKGDKITLWYISANRDEAGFEDPDTFDVGRTPNQHLTFGAGGPHFCLGASLARLEIQIMFEELLERLPDMELSGPIARLRSNFINGTKHIPVRFTPERA